MCKGAFICYAVKDAFGEVKLPAGKNKDCGPRPFYITEDGKYAVPQDLVKFDEAGEALPLGPNTPKYRIQIKSTPKEKTRVMKSSKASSKKTKK